MRAFARPSAIIYARDLQRRLARPRAGKMRGAGERAVRARETEIECRRARERARERERERERERKREREREREREGGKMTVARMLRLKHTRQRR